jgi:hypothetical protein
MNMRPILRICIGSVISAVVVSTMGIVIFVFYANPFQADGPFAGEERDHCGLLQSPLQVFPINSSWSVEVYERKEGDPAPSVLLREGNNEIKWCVYATAYTFSEVHHIQFQRYGSRFIFGTKVEGIVNWTYGYEWTGWYLGPFGGLSKYYYDW